MVELEAHQYPRHTLLNPGLHRRRHFDTRDDGDSYGRADGGGDGSDDDDDDVESDDSCGVRVVEQGGVVWMGCSRELAMRIFSDDGSVECSDDEVVEMSRGDGWGSEEGGSPLAPLLHDRGYDSAGCDSAPHGSAGYDSVLSRVHNGAQHRQFPLWVSLAYPVYSDYWHFRVVVRISHEPPSSTWHSRANTSASTRINEKS